MKALSYLFAFIGILFLLLGIAYLTIDAPTHQTEQRFFICFFGGMVSVVIFLVLNNNPKKTI